MKSARLFAPSLCALALWSAASQAQQTPPTQTTEPASQTTQVEPPREMRKFYLGITVGRSYGFDALTANGKDVAFGLVGGMRLDSRWAVELFVRQLAYGQFLFDATFGGDEEFHPDTHAGVSAIYRLPLSDNIGGYARLGLGKTDLVANQTSLFDNNGPDSVDRKSITDPSVGVGLEVGTQRTGGVKLEATRFTRSKITTALLGVEFKF